jgi:hypothetical protein
MPMPPRSSATIVPRARSPPLASFVAAASAPGSAAAARRSPSPLPPRATGAADARDEAFSRADTDALHAQHVVDFMSQGKTNHDIFIRRSQELQLSDKCGMTAHLVVPQIIDQIMTETNLFRDVLTDPQRWIRAGDVLLDEEMVERDSMKVLNSSGVLSDCAKYVIEKIIVPVFDEWVDSVRTVSRGGAAIVGSRPPPTYTGPAEGGAPRSPAARPVAERGAAAIKPTSANARRAAEAATGDQAFSDAAARAAAAAAAERESAARVSAPRSPAAGAGNYSQSRYLFSCLTPIAKAIFRTEDDSLLTYMDDDGKSIEPEHFMPILPLILFNNMEGIATGWNSKTPSFNPLDVITWIRAYLEGTVSHENPLLPQGQLKPWYIHFKGTVELDEPKEGATYAETFTITGQVSRENGHVIITDLPPKVVPCAYLTFLDKLETKKKIQKYENHSGSDEIHIDITLNSNDLSDDQLKLKAKGSFKGMILLDKKGLPKRFYSAEDVLLYWCPIRLDYYQARKDHLIEVTKTDIMFCKNRIRFITEVNDDTLVIRNRELSEVTTEMESTGYDKKDDKYDYLLSMPIQTISKTRLAKLEDELISKKKELARYKKMTPGDFWETDLATFEIEYQKHLEDRLEKAREPFETREKKKVVRRKKSTV